MELTIKYTDPITKNFEVAYHEGDKDEYKAIMFHDWEATAPKVSFTKIYKDELRIYIDKPCRAVGIKGCIHIVNQEVK